MIREDILQQFSELFGIKKVNGREVNVEETIATLTRELRPAIAEALNARRTQLESSEPARTKYAWPKWEESFEDPDQRSVPGPFARSSKGRSTTFSIAKANGPGD